MCAVAFDSDLAMSLIDEVQQEYVRRYGGRDDTPVDPAEFAPPRGTFLVARLAGVAIGCAGMRRRDDGSRRGEADVRPRRAPPARARPAHARGARGVGPGRGDRRVVLETGLAQPEAIALYRSAGYRPIDGFGHYKDSPLSRSFARDL